jgi:hypothetical protein
MVTASPIQIQSVLLEELGHDFDHHLNGGLDSRGDEGQLFATCFLGQQLGQNEIKAILSENDASTLHKA